LRRWCALRCLIGKREVSFLFNAGDSSKAVIGRVPEDNEDRRFTLYMIGGIALLFKLDERQFLRFLGRLPTGKRVCKVYADALFLLIRQKNLWVSGGSGSFPSE
jgi:hypothetical protein